jgi:DNA topoisomerase IA
MLSFVTRQSASIQSKAPGDQIGDMMQTTPPRRYTGTSLLGAMEADQQGRSTTSRCGSRWKDCGLGTPATRAANHRDLLTCGYVAQPAGLRAHATRHRACYGTALLRLNEAG